MRGVVLLHKLSVVLVFYYLVFYCVKLVCCVCWLVFTLFLLLFLLLKFSRSPLEKTLLIAMSFYYCFSPSNTLRVSRIKTMMRLRENFVSALFRPGIHVEFIIGNIGNIGTVLEITFPLMPFENFDSSFTQ